MDLLTIMRGVELFRGLDANELQALADICTKESFNADATIMERGQQGDKMYIIGGGQVEVLIDEQTPLLFLGAGQVFGEMALVDEGERSASIIAVEDDTLIYSMPNSSFVKLCRSNTQLGYKMMRNIAQDLSFKLRHRNQ